MAGRGCADLVIIPDRREGRDAPLELLAGLDRDRPIRSREQRLAPGGDERWLQWTDRALFDDAGALVEYQSVGRDDSARRRADEQRRNGGPTGELRGGRFGQRVDLHRPWSGS